MGWILVRGDEQAKQRKKQEQPPTTATESKTPDSSDPTIISIKQQRLWDPFSVCLWYLRRGTRVTGTGHSEPPPAGTDHHCHLRDRDQRLYPQPDARFWCRTVYKENRKSKLATTTFLINVLVTIHQCINGTLFKNDI